MNTLLIVLAVVYGIGFFVSLPIAYEKCKQGYDYGSQNLTYNGTGAVGFATVWPLVALVVLIRYLYNNYRKQFWSGAWAVGMYGYMLGIIAWIISNTYPDRYPYLHHVPAYVLVLWIVLPIFWMLCSGFGLHDNFEHELGWRTETYGPNNEYARKVDTTPAKRITLQWLAPFALTYFIIQKKYRKRKVRSH